MSLKVGITGGIGAGKSTISAFFRVLRVPVYEADVRARWLMSHSPPLRADIEKLLGPAAYRNGQLDRPYVAQKIFVESELLSKLNNLIHPRVYEDYLKWHQDQPGCAYTLKEAALLYESGSYAHLDKVITVTAPRDLRMQRVKTRDPHRSERDILEIMDKQLPDEEKIARSDYVIYNDGKTLALPQAVEIDRKLREAT